jgi:hypothetical protein
MVMDPFWNKFSSAKNVNTVEPLYIKDSLEADKSVLTSNWEVSWLQRSNWLEMTNLGLDLGVLIFGSEDLLWKAPQISYREFFKMIMK